MGFDKILNDYRTEILGEEELPPAPAPEGDLGMAPEAPQEEPPSPEEITNEISKNSNKPWIDIASILTKIILQPMSEQQVNDLNDMLPSDLSLSDIANSRNSEQIRNLHAEDLVAASIMLYDHVEKIVSDNGMNDVIPAEER